MTLLCCHAANRIFKQLSTQAAEVLTTHHLRNDTMDTSCTTDPESLTVLFELLADRRRRYALYYLQTASDDVVGFDAVVTQLANWETRLETEPTNDHREEIEIALHHEHLPKLEDHDIIDYDSESETIRYRDGFPKRTWLEQARTEEFETGERRESRTDEETVTTALTSTLKDAYDADVELARSFSCDTGPSYPDWDVTIAEVNRPAEDT
ncbi:DUF7344 domain-containing protein [Haloterrigena gelatinilytica]|uniref:DUF7344 domain-containing protein n=1 Tax=Haloterrigena gelatinilytica TaxID=2741724 RepID=UPI001C2EC1C9|nr:hypothetical protein [Haloterrigena gelatinilytica]